MKKMIKKTILSMLLFAAFTGYSQTSSSGKCFYVDYQQWCDLGYPSIYINCGNDAAFNTGTELTMEVWVRAYIFGENRKIMGKMSSSLNNGYVLGFENLNIYSEIFNPDVQVVPHAGTGPLPVDSAWVHIATTYKANGQMINYLNGINVGEVTVFPQAAIVANSEPFVIGLAPWDLLSYEFTGGLDEVRIWNVARTEAEIKQSMFTTLRGNEPDLVAYYNFNNDVDSIVHDLAPNALNGVLKNPESTCFSWAVSNAPVGDSAMSTKTDINASWYGKNPSQYNYAITTNGLSLITTVGSKQFWNYVVFGHDNKSGKTNTNAPTGAPIDFERCSRVWYVNQTGNFASQVVFNIQDASNGGALITSGGPDSLYTLLMRSDTTSDFQAICSASTVMGNTILFNGVVLSNGYYTIGYSSQKLAGTAALEESNNEFIASVFPNPAQNYFTVELSGESQLSLIDISGKKVYNSSLPAGIATIETSEFPRGIYIFQITSSNKTETHKIVLQ